MKKDPFDIETQYESDKFRFRQVMLEDAEPLLYCYGDAKAAALFNKDNCTSDFYYLTKAEMLNCIKFWVSEFNQKGYIRHIVEDKSIGKIIGTVEFFSKLDKFDDLGHVGLLRIDLASKYEMKEELEDIIDMVHGNLYRDFDVDTIITKAIPLAFERVDALKGYKYKKLEDHPVTKFNDYYYRKNS